VLSDSTAKRKNPIRRLPRDALKSLIFYALGTAILAALITRLATQDLLDQLLQIGWRAAAVFLITPPAWFICHTLSLWVLIDRERHPITFVQLFYTLFVGEALNTLIPLAGLGGEPFKIASLSRLLPLENATTVVVQNKLIHALSGPLFAGLTGSVLLWTSDFSGGPQVDRALLTGSIAMFIGGLVAFWFILSDAPARTLSLLFKKFRPKNDESKKISTSRLWASLLLKLVARLTQFFEVFVILYALNLKTSVAGALLIETLITGTLVIFFIVPQGMGVNEMGVIGAFKLLGLPTPVAVSYGLVRRARVIGWAVIGTVTYLVVRLTRKQTGQQSQAARIDLATNAQDYSGDTV